MTSRRGLAMANLKNKVNPLTWNVPIVNSDGTPTNEFMRAWGQQAAANAAVPDLVTGQALRTVFAASPSGPSQPPAFRLLAVADIPSLLSLYDAAGAAAAAQAAAQAFSSNAANLTSGTVAVARLPVATGAALGVVKPDGVTITIAAGVISAVGGGSSGGAASIQDDGTNVYLALSDTDGQLVLDGAGDPVFMLEVLPPASLPVATAATFGAVKVDNFSIQAVAGVIGTLFAGFVAQLSADQATTSGVWNKVIFNTFITNTLGVQYAVGTGRFTPTKAGKYLVFCSVRGTTTSTLTDTTVSITKNGTWSATGTQQSFSVILDSVSGGGSGSTPLAFAFVDLNGTTDWVEGDARCGGVGTLAFTGAQCFFGALYLGT